MRGTNRWKTLGMALVGAATTIALTGCYEYVEQRPPPPGYPPGPPPAYAPAYTYDYYPDCQVYYDGSRHNYFWIEAGAWRTGPVLPPTIIIHRENRVVVRLDTREPYRRHAEIHARYPAPPPHAPAVGYRRQHEAPAAMYHYEYYPDAQVYYHGANRTYFWREGAAWRSGPRPPRSIVLQPANRVAVDLNSADPSRHHEEVRAKYPGHGRDKDKRKNDDNRGKDRGDRRGD